MAGGKGSRMKTQEEKLLLRYVHPTILHVIFALQNAHCFSKIIAATSSNSPKTKEMLENAGIEIFDTPGTVSYTHLTLPTKRLVVLSCVSL